MLYIPNISKANVGVNIMRMSHEFQIKITGISNICLAAFQANNKVKFNFHITVNLFGDTTAGLVDSPHERPVMQQHFYIKTLKLSFSWLLSQMDALKGPGNCMKTISYS